MNSKDITIGIVGAGGDGVVAAGDILIKSAAHEGLHCMMVKSFGPQIRGGESSCRLRISEGKLHSQGNDLDVLVCFNWDDYRKFTGELDVEDDVVVLVEKDDKTPEEGIPLKGGRKRRIIKIPFNKIAADTGNLKGKNMVMLGVLTELLKLPKKGVELTIKKKFKRKKESLIETNLQAFKAGEDYVKKDLKDFDRHFHYSPGKPSLVLTGNEAVAFGAIAAGCRFFSSYPITPASEIMEWLATELPKFGGALVQAEDEIAAIAMVIGASYGGIKAMTATSGPGLSLMLEAVGLGSMAEIPYVIVDVQRGGPSTGMPTKTEQGDLYQAIYGMHGDAPHAVVAAADVEDCFRATIEAFNIAELFQMPVILMSDQFLGHRTETVRELHYEDVKLASRIEPRQLFEGGYKRYVDTPDGISPMTWPGVKYGEYLCAGIEHDEYGSPSSKHLVHEKMSAKRARKMEYLEKNFKFIRRYGVEDPEIGIVTWGSNKGVVREAVEYFVSKGMSVGALVPQLLYPLQRSIFKTFLRSVKTLIVVENSYGGQFINYLRSCIDFPENVMHLKSSGGRLFTVREVIREIDRAF